MENPSKKSPHLISRLRCLFYVLLAVILSCGCIYSLIYLNFNWEYIRSDFAASQALGRVGQIYNQIIEFTPDGIAVVREREPQSGTYAWGLSDGAPRYAYSRAQQTYSANTGFNDVLALYNERFVELGWASITVDNETGLISSVFRHPDDEHLLAGLCSPTDMLGSSDQLQFIVFFDYDETIGCEGHRGRLGCVAARHCR